MDGSDANPIHCLNIREPIYIPPMVATTITKQMIIAIVMNFFISPPTRKSPQSIAGYRSLFQTGLHQPVDAIGKVLLGLLTLLATGADDLHFGCNYLGDLAFNTVTVHKTP